MAATGKLSFVVTTSTDRQSSAQRRQVRSHIGTTQPRKRRQPKELASWVTRPTRDLDARPLQSRSYAPSAGLGSDMDWLEFAEDMRPDMVQSVVTFLTISREWLYPSHICSCAGANTTDWVRFLLRDAMYLNCMMFATEALMDMQRGKERGCRSQTYLVKSLGLLRGRLTSGPDMASDTTIMTVVILALAAEVFEKGETLKHHLNGLQRMIGLRGGLNAVAGVHELPTKVCRVDIVNSLRDGSRPVFFRDDISWSRYLPQTKHQAAMDTDVLHSIMPLDDCLGNVWADLQQFCHLCRLAEQTGRRIRAETFSEIVVSMLYRLLHMDDKDDAVMAALRIGMMAFCAATLFPGNVIRGVFENVSTRFGDALDQLREADIDEKLLLWLLMVRGVATVLHQVNYATWLNDTAGRLGLDSWSQAVELLKTMAWIPSLFNRVGKEAFEAACAGEKEPEMTIDVACAVVTA